MNQGLQMKKTSAALFLAVCFSWQSADVMAFDSRTVNYTCGRYTGYLQFALSKKTGQIPVFQVNRYFGEEYWGKVSRIASRTAVSQANLRDCSSREFFCIAEQTAGDMTSGQEFVYAVPRVVLAPSKFVKEGQEFNVSLYFGWTPAGDGYAEIWSTNKIGQRYKYVVDGRRGITFIHYSALTMFDLADGHVIPYSEVSCALDSRLGLFSGVKVRGDIEEKVP